jgi:hypothetical protein
MPSLTLSLSLLFPYIIKIPHSATGYIPHLCIRAEIAAGDTPLRFEPRLFSDLISIDQFSQRLQNIAIKSATSAHSNLEDHVQAHDWSK